MEIGKWKLQNLVCVLVYTLTVLGFVGEGQVLYSVGCCRGEDTGTQVGLKKKNHSLQSIQSFQKHNEENLKGKNLNDYSPLPLSH